ncbi:MAG: sulfotransferase [Nitrococcus sp.]|nr:sulfotransferase [Nitrococcus sp.]
MSADKLPGFFVVGAAKAGTTSLYAYLRRVPAVFMPDVKEPHFFSPSALGSNGAHGKVSDWRDYLAIFSGARDKEIIGEASPSYLWDDQSPLLIRSRLPESKIIILLRDPIERAFSHYLADVRLGWQKLPFHQALQADLDYPRKQWGQSHLYLELGCYVEQISRYFRNFGRENVKVVLFDDLKEEPMTCLTGICSFLGVNPLAPLPARSETHNAAAVPRGHIGRLLIGSSALRRAAQALIPSQVRALCRDHLLLTASKPQMESQARAFLKGYYKEETQKLQTLLDRRLPWASSDALDHKLSS